MAVIGFHPSAGHQHEYRFRLNGFLVLYFALGIMISIRLGSIGFGWNCALDVEFEIDEHALGATVGVHSGGLTAHHFHHDPIHASDPNRAQTGSAN
jgi:hypothetical protein